MDPDSSTYILVLFVLLALHAFFAAAKEAIVSIRKSRRLQLIEEGRRGARRIDSLADDASRLLATEQFVLKFIGFFIIAFAVLVFSPRLAQALFTNDLVAAGIIIILAGLATLIFGELVPREIARHRAESIAFSSIPIMYLLSYIVAPLARMVTRFSWRLTGRSEQGTIVGLGIITEEDLRAYVDASEEGGALRKDEKAMIYSIFNLDDTLAREIMIPRIDVVAVEAQTRVRDALDVILEAGHSRLPVFSEHIDNVVGILYAKDLLAHWRDGAEPSLVHSLVREVYFVPETKPVSELLRELQTRKLQIAIVVDEYGGMAGLVTIEDVVEEIVGEIQDEYDSDEFFMERITDHEYIFNARADLDDINHIMDIELPTAESDTLGGLVYTMIGRVPEVGDSVVVADTRLTVLAVDGHRIGRVKIQLLQETSSNTRPEESQELPLQSHNHGEKLMRDTRNTVSGSP